jgi:hypothetical protein
MDRCGSTGIEMPSLAPSRLPTGQRLKFVLQSNFKVRLDCKVLTVEQEV